MTLDKEDKKCLVCGFVVCFVIAAIVTFNIWMWRSTNRPEIPDSSKEEIKVVVKDTAETIKLQALNKSLSAENAKLKLQIKQIITHVPQKLKQNEKNIYYAVSHGDSIKMLIADSLLRTAGYK